MAEMKALLSFLDAEERLKVMRRYERSFDAVGREGEAALIREMGSPVRQVLIVEREYREREEAGLPGVADEEYVEEVSASVIVPMEEPVEETAAPAEDALAEPLHGDEDVSPVLVEEPADDESEEVGETPYIPDAEEETEIEPEDEEEYEEEEEGDEAPGTGRIIGAVALTPIMIVLAVGGVALTLALTAVSLAPGFGFGAAAVYLALYAFHSMSFLPDIILVCGLAVIAAALSLFFLWLAVWLLVTGIRQTIRLISGVYGKVLRKGGADNE